MIAELGLQIDSSPVAQAAADLDSLTVAAGKAEAATVKVSGATSDLAAAIAAAGSDGLTKNLVASMNDMQRLYSGGNSIVQASLAPQISSIQQEIIARSAQVSAVKQSTLAVAAEKVATTENAAAIAMTTATLHNSENGHRAFSTQAMAAQHAVRGFTEMMIQGVPVQQAAMMEMNHLTYAMSHPDGLIGALKEGIGVFGAFISPVGIAITAVGGMAVAGVLAAKSWSDSQSSIKTSLIGVGAASGATVDAINYIADASSKTSNVSVKHATEIETALAKTGEVSVDSFSKIIAGSQNLEKVLGVSGPKAADAIAQIFADPAKGADDLNKRLGFLTAAMKAQMDTMLSQNDTQGASELLIDAVANSTTKATDATTGWSKAWDNLGNSISNYWSKLGQGIDAAAGLNQTPEMKYNVAQANIAGLQKTIAPMQTEADRLASAGASQDQIKLMEPALFTLSAALIKAEADAAKYKSAMDAAGQSSADAADKINAAAASRFSGAIIDAMNPDAAKLQDMQGKLAQLKGLSQAGFNNLSPEQQGSYDQTLQQYKEAIDTYIPSAQKMVDMSNLQMQALNALSPASKAAIAAERERLNLSGEAGAKYDDATKAILIHNAAIAASGGVATLTQMQMQCVSTLGELKPVVAVKEKPQLENKRRKVQNDSDHCRQAA